ncbi:MAG: hypothetical protein MUP98_00065 [Candidatus Aminicenantes bacterium]|nr:hypothetical protein [Candidatus Aminicenantes bacterium]
MTFLDKTKGFFFDQPKPLAAFQMASNYVTGVQLSSRDKKIESFFTLLLEEGIIEPSFYRNNIKKRDLLSKLFDREMKKFLLTDRRVVFVLPELSQKAFVLAFEKLPAQLKERDRLVQFRVKKQMPLLPDDARIAYSLIPTENKVRVLASVARGSVIKEYEDFFDRLKIKVRSVGMPFEGLINLIGKKEKNVMLVNIERDAFSLVGITSSEISLYRQKSFVLESIDEKSLQQKNADITLEIENTIRFLEDKENTKMSSLWVRTGLPGDGDLMLSDLASRLSIPVEGIDTCLPGDMGPNEKRLLSPLLGHIQ